MSYFCVNTQPYLDNEEVRRYHHLFFAALIGNSGVFSFCGSGSGIAAVFSINS